MSDKNQNMVYIENTSESILLVSNRVNHAAGIELAPKSISPMSYSEDELLKDTSIAIYIRKGWVKLLDFEQYKEALKAKDVVKVKYPAGFEKGKAYINGKEQLLSSILEYNPATNICKVQVDITGAVKEFDLSLLTVEPKKEEKVANTGNEEGISASQRIKDLTQQASKEETPSNLGSVEVAPGIKVATNTIDDQGIDLISDSVAEDRLANLGDK